MHGTLTRMVIVIIAAASVKVAVADEPMTLRLSFRGDVDVFATGTNLAADNGGNSGTVDTLIQPQTVTVRAPQDLPADAELEAAFLYWAGSRTNSDCANPLDDTVTLTVPGGTASAVTADVCYCGEGTASYDQQACRYDMTQNLRDAGGQLHGDYTVDDFAARASDNATDNASFSVILVYRHPSVGVRQITLYDGIWELISSHPDVEHQSVTFNLSGFEVDDPPRGSITYYVIEGDGLAGSGEAVLVNNTVMTDAVNTAANPYNRTINTVDPPRTGVVGVDIDRFDISSLLSPGDTQLDVTFGGGRDKVWVIYNLVTVTIFEPVFLRSTKSWLLADDADSNSIPSAGDTIRYTLELRNSGNESGTVNLLDALPSAFTNVQLVSSGPGNNLTSGSTVDIRNISVPIGTTHTYVIDAVLTDVPDETEVVNVASYSDPPEGGTGGDITAEPVIVRRDGDSDGVFDNDDNCPLLSNTNQDDGDGDGVGDVCDVCPLDNPDDSDNDTVCDTNDLCPGEDDREDADADTLPDACDVCPGFDDREDADADTVPDGCDICSAGDDALDADSDSVPNACDVCPGADDTVDADSDNVPDGCDICAAGDDAEDADFDTVPDACDVCPGKDDREDADTDTVPDGCDVCPGFDDRTDADGDTVPNGCDVCPGGDDRLDADLDGIPNFCDACLPGQDGADADGDTVPDACDVCPGEDDTADADGDRVPDACDVCPDGDDTFDGDGDTVPDDCDVCAGGDDTLDTDGDGTPDACASETCDDGLDNDGDGDADCDDIDCATDAACAPAEPGVELADDPRNPATGTPDDCDCRVRATSAPQSPGLLWLSGLALAGLLNIRRRRPR